METTKCFAASAPHAPARAVGPSTKPTPSCVLRVAHESSPSGEVAWPNYLDNLPLSSWTKRFISEKSKLPSASSRADESSELPEELLKISPPP